LIILEEGKKEKMRNLRGVRRLVVWVVTLMILFCIPEKQAGATQQNATQQDTAQQDAIQQDITQQDTTQQEVTNSQYKPGKVKGLKVTATSKGAIKLSWKKVSGAKKYRIYRSKSKNGKYKIVGTTPKTKYTDKRGKQKKTYYYKVVAIRKNPLNGEWVEGTASKVEKKKVRKKAKRVAYVGDSIMTGFSIYHVTKSGDRTFAKIGMNATSFCRSDLYASLLRYNPDRIFLMFGMNGLPGNPSGASMDNQVKCISGIINKCRKNNPDVEIVIMGVSPVTARASVHLSSVRLFNKKLKNSLKNKKGVHYYNPATVLANEQGYLKSGYGGGDGIHWSVAAYKKVYQSLQDFVKEW
jgi:lysophospholipase L1-like esterase